MRRIEGTVSAQIQIKRKHGTIQTELQLKSKVLQNLENVEKEKILEDLDDQWTV